jgi:uncharacterized protein (DUF1810 family)
MPNPSDPYNLGRFIVAQQADFARALDELRQGRKRTHWMWYIFPQLAGLGWSATSRLYAIQSRDEARAYLAHPVLGPRLLECTQAMLRHEGRTARDILGWPDVLKLRSCATLFAAVAPAGSLFEQILARYYDGQPDQATLQLLADSAPA